MAAARGPAASGRGCCCCCRRGHSSPAPRRCMARPPGSGPEQVTWCRDRPPPEAPPSRPPPAGPAAARGATCRRRRRRRTRRRLHCRSRRRRPRSPGRAPAPPSLPVPVPPSPPLPASPPPGRSLQPPGFHPGGQQAPTQVGTDPGPAPWPPPPAPRSRPDPLSLSFLSFSFPTPLPRSFSPRSLSPPSASLFSFSTILSLSPLFLTPSFFFFHLLPSLSIRFPSPLPPLLILFLSCASSLSHPLLWRVQQLSSRPCNGFLFGCSFGKGAIPVGRSASVPPWSRATQWPSFQSLRVDFDPYQPPPVHLQARGLLPAGTVLARGAPHPAGWFAARSGCFPRVLCRAGATDAELFVLIVQSIGAQIAFVSDLHPCAPASTLDRKENELIRPIQLCSSPK